MDMKTVALIAALCTGAAAAQASTTAQWAWSLDTSGTGVAGEFFANANGVFGNVGNGPYQMQVSIDGGGGDLYNNIGAVTSGTDPVASFGPLADSFSTLGAAVPVADLAFLLEGNPGSGGLFEINLLADNGSTPGALIVSSGPLPDSFLNSTLTPLGATCFCSLAPNTRYWLQIADAGSAVPEPAAWALMLTGFGGLGAVLRSRRRTVAQPA